jgi:hypothetical protein
MALTATQAATALDEAVHGAASAAGVADHLTRGGSPGAQLTSCFDPDEAQKGMQQVHRYYLAKGLPDATRKAAVQAMRDYWVSHGWTLSNERGVGQEETAMNMVRRDNGLSLSLNAGVGGIAVIMQSGCVTPDGSSPSPAP